MCGKIPSSRPVRNTTGNSSPFAVCSVISVIALVVVVGVHVGDERDALEERLHPVEAARRLVDFAVAEIGDRGEHRRVAGVERFVELLAHARRARRRFSMRPCASIVRSASSSAR